MNDGKVDILFFKKRILLKHFNEETTLPSYSEKVFKEGYEEQHSLDINHPASLTSHWNKTLDFIQEEQGNDSNEDSKSCSLATTSPPSIPNTTPPYLTPTTPPSSTPTASLSSLVDDPVSKVSNKTKISAKRPVRTHIKKCQLASLLPADIELTIQEDNYLDFSFNHGAFYDQCDSEYRHSAIHFEEPFIKEPQQHEEEEKTHQEEQHYSTTNTINSHIVKKEASLFQKEVPVDIIESSQFQVVTNQVQTFSKRQKNPGKVKKGKIGSLKNRRRQTKNDLSKLVPVGCKFSAEEICTCSKDDFKLICESAPKKDADRLKTIRRLGKNRFAARRSRSNKLNNIDGLRTLAENYRNRKLSLQKTVDVLRSDLNNLRDRNYNQIKDPEIKNLFIELKVLKGI